MCYKLRQIKGYKVIANTERNGRIMDLLQVINVVALVIIPILAIILGRWLQDRAEKRKDKMQIFKTLMIARVYSYTRESVEALNIIDIVFSDDKSVRDAWAKLYDSYKVVNPDEMHLQKIQQNQYKLLESMANTLGYKNEITWETIQNPYIPVGYSNQIKMQESFTKNMTSLTEQMTKMSNSQVINNGNDSNNTNSTSVSDNLNKR